MHGSAVNPETLTELLMTVSFISFKKFLRYFDHCSLNALAKPFAMGLYIVDVALLVFEFIA